MLPIFIERFENKKYVNALDLLIPLVMKKLKSLNPFTFLTCLARKQENKYNFSSFHWWFLWTDMAVGGEPVDLS